MDEDNKRFTFVKQNQNTNCSKKKKCKRNIIGNNKYNGNNWK